MKLLFWYWSPDWLSTSASFSTAIDICSLSCAQCGRRRSWLSWPILCQTLPPARASEYPTPSTTCSFWGRGRDDCTTSPCTPGWISRIQWEYTCDRRLASNWSRLYFFHFCCYLPVWRVLGSPLPSRGCAGGWVWGWGSRIHKRWLLLACWGKASRESVRHSGTI